MVNNVGYQTDNVGAYTEDLSKFFSSIPQAGVEAVGFLANRTVLVLTDLAKIAKSSEALRYTLDGIIDLATLVNLVITVHISDKFVAAAKVFSEAVTAWKIGASLKYITHGKFMKDIQQMQLATVVAELFFFVARCVKTTVWLVEQKWVTYASASGLVGSIPMFGASLLAIGATPVSTVCFVAGISFLFVDRLRAALKGGYASAQVEQEKSNEVRNKMMRSLRDPITQEQSQEIARAVAEKKSIQHSIAWADCICLAAEAIMLTFSLNPITLCSLGVVASTTSVAATLWDKEPQNNLRRAA